MNKKKERFIRVGSRRVEAVIKSLRLLSNCSNINNYDYNEEDINKMLRAIKEQMKITETMFKKHLTNPSNKFNF